jgi:hypothetical protein
VRRGQESSKQVGEALLHGRVGQATKEVALETARQYGEGLKFSGETAVSAAKIGYAALAGRERRKKKSRKKKSRQRRARTKKS